MVRREQPPTELDPHDLPPGTKVWIYVRHSPGDNQTLESQEAVIMRLVNEKKWIADRIFRDRGVSGRSTDNRQAFEQMVHLAKRKPRPADLLIVWEFSRFARNQTHSQLYRAQLRHDGWQILSMNDDIPAGPLATIFEALIDWKNEQYLIDLRANTKRGLLYIAERGCLPVASLCKGYTHREEPLGAYRDSTPRMGRKPCIDPAVAPLVVRAFEMKAQGAPHEVIANETGLFDARSGSWDTMFRNRAYIGEYEFQNQVFTNVYEPLISRELFDAVQARMPVKATRRLAGENHPRRKGSTFFLANIAHCAYCDAPMEGKRTGNYRYYVCSRHNEDKTHCLQSVLIPADAIEERVISILVEQVLDEAYLTELLAWTNETLNEGLDDLVLRLEQTQRELAEAEAVAVKYARNFGAMNRPTATAERLLHEQDELVDKLRAECASLQHEYENSRVEIDGETLRRYISDAGALIANAEVFDLRDLVEQLLSRIVMSADECVLELHVPQI